MATVTDPYYGVLTLQTASATTLLQNPACDPAMPCATPLLNTSGVPSEDYTVAVFDEKSTSIVVDSTGITSTSYTLVSRTLPFWEFTDHTNACFATMTSCLQLESAVGFDFTIGFDKGAYAVATSVELDASQGATVDWIYAMETNVQSFFISAYLPQFTEDFSSKVLAAPTESVAAASRYATSAFESSPSSKPLVARRMDMRSKQQSMTIGTTLDGDNSTILAIAITLSFLAPFGGCLVVFCWVRSKGSKSSETTNESRVSDHADVNGEDPSVASTMSETSFRAEPLNFEDTFSHSEASGPRHSRVSAQRFVLGSSISSSSSSSSSEADFVVTFNNLDDPFSDTALISSLAREPTPAVSPSQNEPHHERLEDNN